MPALVNLTGIKFGRLLVLYRDGRLGGHIAWKVQCDCGVTKRVSGPNLRNGESKSCGCLKSELLNERNVIHGAKKNGVEERLYVIWKNMKKRCYSASEADYPYWQGRGITVCDEWRSDYSIFRDWALSNGYQDNLSIGRVDNDKGYYPDNCRWATDKEQSNNRRYCRSENHKRKTNECN